MNIPLVHLQGGEVSGSIDEKVRHSITKLADAHLVSTERAAQRVIQMGERPDRVHLTGCPSVDIAAQILDDPRLDFDPFERYGGVGESFDYTRGYVVVLQHPVTTEYAVSRQHAIETLEAVRALELPAFWFWPNVDAGSDGTSKALRAYREHFEHEDIHFFKNMAPSDFLKLIYNSSVLIGNSSVGIRECSFLGVPVVNIGTRQQGRERGQNVVDCDYARDEIHKAALQQIGAGRYHCDTTYGDGGAGKRVADVLTVIPLEVEKQLTY
jgi:UDP-hydrolysing UDP-N-acetyl-D-glucosamine 2-epimerase